MTSDTKTSWPLRDALKTAQAMLDQNLGMIEGCIALSAYAHRVVPDWTIDPDFVVFEAISSSTDHLPFGDVRARWSATALTKADAEIAAAARFLGGDSHRRFHSHRCRHGIVVTIPANNENRSRSHWNRVHVPLESAFTMRWKPRSRTTGICRHERAGGRRSASAWPRVEN
jgi:hypothetical protein